MTAAATTCTVATHPTGPMVTADGGLLLPPVPPPADWSEPDQVDFDWDADGASDTLGFDQDAAAIVVTWADGSLTVRGVRSDFAGDPGQPIEPGGDPFLEQPTEAGPPSEASIDADLAAPIPAAVADVTGDGLLDLLVVDEGVASVVVGAGADSATVDVDEAAIGTEVAGWRNPPVVPVPPTGVAADQPPGPMTRPPSCPAGT